MTELSNLLCRKFGFMGTACLVIIALCICNGCNSREVAQDSSNTVAEIAENAVNINTADQEMLEKIPYVGAKLAREIIEYRQKYGPFRRPEHLLLINGISDKRFREIRHLIRVD